jgi:O-succinylbenzoic acid--CoA ligase
MFTQLDWVAKAAATHPQQMAFEQGDLQLSFLDVERTTARLAYALQKEGWKRGDILCTWMPPDLGHHLLLLAALRSGLVIHPIQPRLPQKKAEEAAAMLGNQPLMKECPPEGEKRSEDLGVDPGQPATVLSTSGSMDGPKALVHSLRAHLAAASASQTLLPVGPGRGWVQTLPLCHVSGLSILFRCILHGGTIRLGGLQRSGDYLSLVPPQLEDLLGSNTPLENFSGLLCGGAPFPEKLLRKAMEGGAKVHLTYGMTETASQICTSPALLLNDPPITCGHPLRGRSVSIDPEGEIFIKSDSLAMGTLEDGKLVPLKLINGWLATGDCGTMDAKGLMITGRKDRMFISGGENLHPELIEQAILQLPGVRRCAVVSLPDERYGRIPCAFLAGEGFDFDQLQQSLRRELPGFAVPKFVFPWPVDIDERIGKIPFGLLSAKASALTAKGYIARPT